MRFVGGNLNAELAYNNHPSVAPHAVAVHQKICADVVHGRAVVLKSTSASDIRGLRVSPLADVIKPTFFTIHDLTFGRAGGYSSVFGDIDFTFAPSCELFGMCCYGCWFFGRCTVPQLKSSFAALT